MTIRLTCYSPDKYFQIDDVIQFETIRINKILYIHIETSVPFTAAFAINAVLYGAIDVHEDYANFPFDNIEISKELK